MSGNFWMIAAFITPLAWSAVNILDVYFSKKVYATPYDGAIISGIFQGGFLLLPLLGIIEIKLVDFPTALVGIGAGIFFQMACLFYFKALFANADVVLMQIIWNMSIAVLPLLTFFLLGHQLGLWQYAGIAIVFACSLIFNFGQIDKNRLAFKSVLLMIASMLLFSTGKFFEGYLFNELNSDFWSGYFLFSIGNLLTGLFLLLRNRRVINVVKNNAKIIIFSELLSVIATVASAQAIKLSPSVSLVVLIESYTPVFTLLFSFIILLSLSKLHVQHRQEYWLMLHEQLFRIKAKIIAVTGMSIGVYLI